MKSSTATEQLTFNWKRSAMYTREIVTVEGIACKLSSLAKPIFEATRTCCLHIDDELHILSDSVSRDCFELNAIINSLRAKL